MRYIRYKREKQQINFLNCNELDKWVDTCHYRPTEFYDICEDCCTGGTIEPTYEWVLDSTICGSELGSGYLSDYLYEKWVKYDETNNSIISVDYRNGVPSEECGYVPEEIAFEFTGETMTFKLNEVDYIADTSPYTATLYELGVYKLTSCYYTFASTPITSLNKFPSTSAVTDMRNMFNYCQKLTSLDLSNFDTSNVANMSRMFYNSYRLTSLDLSNFDTSKVTDMRSMFGYCSDLTSLDISNFDTSKVTDMSYMFQGCNKLSSLDVSHFNTSAVTDMRNMFYDCSKLTHLDVSNFDTSKVTNMTSMFGMCKSLTNLDVSHFDTSNVTSMNYMFGYSSGLTSLDLSNFDTSKVTSMSQMFYGCTSLTSVDLSGWIISNDTGISSMFYNCENLKTIYMRGCSADTISNIERALTNANIRDNVTIITT